MRVVRIFVAVAAMCFSLSAADLNEFLDKGKNLFSSGRYKEAYFLFAQATRDFPESALAWYNLGITGYKLGLWKEAAENLRKAARLSEKIFPQATYYRGICLWKMGKKSLAREAFEKVIKASPFSRYAWASKANLGKIRGMKERWTFFASVSGEYDDNVNYEPVSIDVSARDKDYRASAIFSGSYGFAKWLTGGYSFYGTKYNQFSNLDFLQHTAKVTLPAKISKREISRLGLKYWSSQLNGEKYQTGYKIEEKLSFLKKRRGKIEILLAFASKDYFKKYSYLDGTSYEIGIRQDFASGNWKLSATCGYKIQDAKDNSGTESSYTYYTSPTTSISTTTAFFRSYSFGEYKIGVKAGRKISGVNFSVSADYGSSRYKDKDSWFEKKEYYLDSNNNWYEIVTDTYTHLEPTSAPTAKTKLRKDKQFSVNVSLSKAVSKNASISLEYDFTDTKSTIGKGDYMDRNYRRTVISVALNFLF